jgi:hypothetical protein
MDIAKGDFVRHSKNSEWGLGKVLKITSQHVTVFFLDSKKNPMTISTEYLHLFEPASAEDDPRILNLPSEDDLINSEGKGHLTFAAAVDRFEKIFPLWFEDEFYLKGERKYKWDAHELMLELLNVDETNNLLVKKDFHELVQRTLKVVSSVGLLSPYENMALSDAVKGEEEKELFANALVKLLHGDEAPEVRFEKFSHVLSALPVKQARLYTWPVQTLLPYLMFPDREMFLKPVVTQETAQRLAFEINYRSEPNWLTYSKLLELADILFEKLAHYKPRDLIDIQSFIWYVSDDIYHRFGRPVIEG